MKKTPSIARIEREIEVHLNALLRIPKKNVQLVKEAKGHLHALARLRKVLAAMPPDDIREDLAMFVGDEEHFGPGAEAFHRRRRFERAVLGIARAYERFIASTTALTKHGITPNKEHMDQATAWLAEYAPLIDAIKQRSRRVSPEELDRAFRAGKAR